MAVISGVWGIGYAGAVMYILGALVGLGVLLRTGGEIPAAASYIGFVGLISVLIGYAAMFSLRKGLKADFIACLCVAGGFFAAQILLYNGYNYNVFWSGFGVVRFLLTLFGLITMIIAAALWSKKDKE
ncbi:MAG: hypothetical protein IJM62_08100, partial [Lachnospiraceae bacterium]|nr:hypothetical protein [Lachnospiraceae bacterium]